MLSLVFIPGVMDTPRIWEHQVKYLSDVAEPSVADVTKQETISEMAETVLAFAPEKFALVGFSLGGYIALEIMRIAPKRVVKLALLGTSARPDVPARRERRFQQIEMLSKMPFPEFTRAHAPNYVHPDRANDPVYTEMAVSMAVELGTEVFIRQNMAATHRPDARSVLGKIDCPTLIVAGRQDSSMLAASEELAEKIPNSRFVVVEECGHYLSIERPHALTALLREWILYA